MRLLALVGFWLLLCATLGCAAMGWICFWNHQLWPFIGYTGGGVAAGVAMSMVHFRFLAGPPK